MSNASPKTVAIDHIIHRGLEVLADDEHRTLGGQVAYLVEQALRSKGIELDSLISPEQSRAD